MGAKVLLKRKILMLAIILVSLLTLSLVSASDNVTVNTASIDDTNNEIVSLNDNQEILQGNGPVGTFQELSELVENTSETHTLKLQKDSETAVSVFTANQSTATTLKWTTSTFKTVSS